MVHAALTAMSSQPEDQWLGEHKRQRMRLRQRLELRIIILATSDLAKITPGEYRALGTSSLKPEEVRALIHVLSSSGITSSNAHAAKYLMMLKERALTFPDKLDDEYRKLAADIVGAQPSAANGHHGANPS